MKRTVCWSDLGRPVKPGRVLVEGIGCVEISQKAIGLARQHGGNPWFELIEVSVTEKPGEYRLGGIRPHAADPLVSTDQPWQWTEHGAARYPD